MAKKRGVNRLVWFERYAASDPNITARRNVAILEKVVGRGNAWVDEDSLADHRRDTSEDVMLGIETTDAGKFKKAVEMIMTMRGEVLGDIVEFVWKGRKREGSWDLLESLTE